MRLRSNRTIVGIGRIEDTDVDVLPENAALLPMSPPPGCSLILTLLPAPDDTAADPAEA